MNKWLKYFLLAAIAAALTLICVCTADYLSLGRQLRDYETRLADSRNTWETIAAEKELLQEDLKAGKKALRETELKLKESTERAEELKAEIEQLKNDIEILKTR